MPQPITPDRFKSKWSRVELSERAASQSHFIDLCYMLGQPSPTDHDATGDDYTFEKGVAVAGPASLGAAGEHGFADVWWRGRFAWEYKRRGKYRDLTDAYRQLCQYREALENPPLLIVSDIARTEIHTNFTGTAKRVHTITLDQIDTPEALDLLRRVFTDPESFRPTLTTEVVTKEIAEQFARLARSLREFGGHDAHTVAHYLMKCMFCLFAEDVELLPNKLFTKIVERYRRDPAKLADRLTELFDTMRTGGHFGEHEVKHFNGGLFDDAPALRMTAADIDALWSAAGSDWGSVEPAIFGTLFERSLDPNTRAQIGAHYTSREDIMLVVEPVVMAPLRREWAAVKGEVEALLEKRRTATTKQARTKADRAIESALRDFVQRLAGVRILDPACGSGNFLYVAIQQLLALEKEVITHAARPEIASPLFPQVRPTQLLGIEINPYAAELAQVVIWIGYLQWMRDNGYIDGIRTPILEPLQTIECRDAILDLSDPRNPAPAKWPEADFIIGNPPFLGSKLFRAQGLPNQYVDGMYSAFDLPKASDLCCYWFELARRAIGQTGSVRIGLLATQGIRGGDNREVLERIKRTGDIFMVWSDRDWILDGAAVHVSIIGFDGATEPFRQLDGRPVNTISADLRADGMSDRPNAISENGGLAFQGPVKVGEFDVDAPTARRLLATPNATGLPNSKVVRRWIRGEELNKRCEHIYIIDFEDRELPDAATFESPFEFVVQNVRAFREQSRDAGRRTYWWRLGRSGADFRSAVGSKRRYLATCQTAKHRLFAWQPWDSLPAQTVIAFGRSDDYFLGILQGSIHELWGLRMGTQLETRPRYTPTTCFETFPLPWPPGKEPARNEAYKRIAATAKELNEQRERWLNPPEWIEPIAQAVDAEDDFADVPAEARPLIRQSAIMARAAKDPRLKKRTLTNLYNERPTWLKLAHEKLDRAVLSAYAAVDPEGNWSEDWAEVWVDSGAGFPLPEGHALFALRKEVDQMVLANLLRMNLERAD